MSRYFGPCMCGDPYCHSCGTAMGFHGDEPEDDVPPRTDEERRSDVARVARAFLLYGLPVSLSAAETAWERTCRDEGTQWVEPPSEPEEIYRQARAGLEGLAAQVYRVHSGGKVIGVVLAMSQENAIAQFFPKGAPTSATYARLNYLPDQLPDIGK